MNPYHCRMKDRILSLFGFPPPTPLVRSHTPWKDGETEADNALIVDGRDVADEKGLKDIFLELQVGVKKLRPNGKVLLYSLQPEMLGPVGHSTFQRALEGIVRSLAKELGRRGTTVNLLRLPESTEPSQFAFAQEFFTTGRSAFITGQALSLNTSGTMDGDLSDKVCLVTGGAGGIGSATVKRLAAEGAQVVVVDMPQMEERARPFLSDRVLFLAADLTDGNIRRELLQKVKERFGRMDVLVNNAGITRDKTLKNMSEQYWDELIAINLAAVTGLTEEALALSLIPDGGRIINTSSISGIAGNFGQTNYTAAKAALIGYAAKRSEELEERRITVNAIAPGYIETEMLNTIPMMTRIFAERLTCLSQAGRPEDIAEAMTFLAYPACQAVNGQVLRVCGGNFLGA